VPDPAVTETVISADGTVIAVDRCGTGPAVLLVHGAFTDRTHPTLVEVAAALAPWFTVFNYDRRGRGASGDTPDYAVERELEDIDAVIAVAGGSAMVFGGSSGSALALQAAARSPQAITRLAVWEPPFHVSDDAPQLPADFADQLAALVERGRRADAVELFFIEAAGVPREAIAAMRADPSWAATEALAHTLAYEARVMGPDNALPGALLSAVGQPSLVLYGGSSPAWMTKAALAVADAVPHAVSRRLEGQTHNVAADALVPELLEFLARA
jgi:pimeloyl-ACP methyl ester carboxylesterase